MTLIEFFEKWGAWIITTIVLPVVLYLFKSTFATKSDLDREKRRISTLEHKVENLPNTREFQVLSEKIAGISSDMEWLKTNVKLLVETEMSRGKKE